MRRRLLALAAVAAVAPFVLTPVAGAQTADEELTGYVGTASGAIFTIQPVFPGLLPTGDAPFEVTGGLSVANAKSGGLAFGQAEAVWPGSGAANIGPLLAQAAGNEIFYQLPAYPLGVQASEGDEPASQGVAPGPVVKASGQGGKATSVVQAGGGGIPGIFTFGSSSSSSRSVIENGTLVSESTVELHDIVIGAGQATMDAIKSVSRATSNGATSDSKGSTDVTGLKVQGQGATLDRDGIKGAGPLIAPLAEGLKQAGIELELIDGTGGASGGAADRLSSGVLLTIANPAAAANPQFAGSHFVVSLGPTAAGALASPPFDDSSFDDIALPSPLDTGSGGGFSTIAGSIGDVYGSLATPKATTGAPATALGLEPVRTSVAPADGFPFGLLVGLGLIGILGARRISKYAARYVSNQE